MPSLKGILSPTPVFLPFLEPRCFACASPLRYDHKSSGRDIFRLDRWVHVTAQVYHCPNGRCPLVRQPVHPAEEWSLAPPRFRVGTDVVAEIGKLRMEARLTRPEIRQRLESQYGLVLSDRQVGNLYELFAALVAGANLQDVELISQLKKQRVLVVSLDAAKPIRGDDAVWFVREVVSGRTLIADCLHSSTAEAIGALLEPVREFAGEHDLRVVGIVSDAEANIRKAVGQVFPRVPHQLCQLHFIQNLAEELRSADQDLRGDLRKPFRALRPIERSIQTEAKSGELGSGQQKAMKDLCAALHSILKDNGKAPFNPPGLKLYGKLLRLRKTLEKLVVGKGQPKGCVRALLKLLDVVDEVRDRQEWLQLYYEDIWEISEVLFTPGRNAKEAKKMMKEKREGWQAELVTAQSTDETPKTQRVLSEWERLTDLYWPGLFHCLVNPRIPATNNGTERAILALKQLERVLSRNPKPAKRFVRNAATNAYFLNLPSLPGEEFIATRRPHEFQQAAAYLKERRRQAGIAYQARRNFDDLLLHIATRFNENLDDTG